MDIETGLEKLNSLLPLVERQQRLKPEHREIHRKILNSFAYSGKAPEKIEESILKILAENDLVVLDDKHEEVIGAYPFSLRETAHRVFNENIDIYAMCAFDAVAIAPVFNVKTNIISYCHVTNEKIEIVQNSNEVIEVKLTDNIYIGIRWQSPGSCAADNLCMEMIFLKDESTAKKWQDGNETYSIFSLSDAIIFASKYFKPLITENAEITENAD